MIALEAVVKRFGADRPLGGARPELAVEVSVALRRLAAEGVTMVIATHVLRLASSIARDVLSLKGGRVVEAGPAAQVFGVPRQARTAEFIRNLGSAAPRTRPYSEILDFLSGSGQCRRTGASARRATARPEGDHPCRPAARWCSTPSR